MIQNGAFRAQKLPAPFLATVLGIVILGIGQTTAGLL